MISINADTANAAWLEVFKNLIRNGENTGNSKYMRDEPTLIHIKYPKLELADSRFPMLQHDIDVINEYIVTGNNESKVSHEWTKIYHHRMFDNPNSQIEFLIQSLSAETPSGESQISMWDKNIDQSQKFSPCTQIVWARIKHGKLELHVHAHSSDAYKKLLMNLLEFIAVQKYIANRIGIETGNYYHFIDSCHLHEKDSENINTLYNSIDL